MPEKAFKTFRNLSILASGTFAFMAGIFTMVLMDKGLDLAQVAFYFMIYSASALLLEVPSGAFADAFGRKKAIISGFSLHVIFLAAFLFLREGPVFLAFSLVVAAADALLSGSSEAHAVDMLYERGKTDYTHKLLGSARSWTYIILLIGAVLGGYAATFSVDYSIALCFIFAVAGLFYSIFGLSETSRKKEFVKLEHAIYRNMAEAVGNARKNPPVAGVYALSLLLGISTFGLFVYWQPVMAELAGWGTDTMGIYFALLSTIVIVAAKLSHRLPASLRTAALLSVCMSILLCAVSMVPFPLLIAVLILAWEFLWGAYTPLDSTIINDSTPSSIRATAISVNFLFFQLGWVLVGAAVFFLGADEPRLYWLFGGLILFLGALAILAKNWNVSVQKSR